MTGSKLAATFPQAYTQVQINVNTQKQELNFQIISMYLNEKITLYSHVFAFNTKSTRFLMNKINSL